jgi:hypothetical protein
MNRNTLFVTTARVSLYQQIDIFLHIFTELTDIWQIFVALNHIFLQSTGKSGLCQVQTKCEEMIQLILTIQRIIITSFKVNTGYTEFHTLKCYAH